VHSLLVVFESGQTQEVSSPSDRMSTRKLSDNFNLNRNIRISSVSQEGDESIHHPKVDHSEERCGEHLVDGDMVITRASSPEMRSSRGPNI
jgi:hypothetical protein